MKIKQIVSALERFAPLPLQDGYDNAGLQIGLTEAEATGACCNLTLLKPCWMKRSMAKLQSHYISSSADF